jgi:hypothetical protein
LGKSEARWIGLEDAKEKNANPNVIGFIDFKNEGIQILGIFFFMNKDLFLIETIKACLSIWKTRHLTLFDKIQIVGLNTGTRATSSCLLKFKLVVPVDFLKKVEKEIVNFVWNRKKCNN